ncbi:MAG: flagellar basal body rod protein FlgC [Pseudomonadota bacterium]
MTLYHALRISASGLSAQRVRLNTTASNIANAETTRTAEGGPYRRRDPVLVASSFAGALDGAVRGVEVARVATDTDPPRMVHDPDHPDADAEGMVAMPNVNPVEEMVNLLTEQRAFEANTTAFKAAKDMVSKALELMR